MKHAGKVAVVTGGSSGIGQAIALRLAADGASVANLDIASGAETDEQAARAGHKLKSFACNLAEPESIRAALGQVAARYAAPTILVHSAAHQFIKPISEVTTAEWRLTQAVNQEAAFHLTQQMLPAMRAASWGRIILISSSTYWVGGVSMTHYVTSKGALLGFAHGLAAEVGPYGVTVNCVAPGLTRTAKAQESLSVEFFQHIASVQSIKRNGTPEDQAGAVSFLASEDAGFITGQTLLVDGGQGRT
ncbi:MAG: SDR family oxidoreductase [Gammaproteobacteria bacterium]|nr:SDR family oxidoreductase [Gammaproteobacteria bacterium]